MSDLSVRLLGAPDLRVEGRPLVFKTRKTLALAAYLLLEPGAHPREKLAGLLWPDVDPEAARASLRNTLAYLRAALGEAQPRLSATRSTVSFDVLLGECDVGELERVAAEARLSSEEVAHLERAVTSWRGELLDGFETSGSGASAASDFDAWLSERRGAVRAAADFVFDRLSERQLEREPARAAETAGRWLTLDRFNEAAWRRLVLARLAAGQRALAKEAFEACRSTLRSELGVTPAPETLALEPRLLDAPLGTARSAPLDLTSVSRDTPLVGRSAAFALLMRAYEDAARGKPSVAWIVGEPGIGKTRLAHAFSGRAAEDGARAARTRVRSEHARLRAARGHVAPRREARRGDADLVVHREFRTRAHAARVGRHRA
ncbi:BTAD domain-containing putative transcriptional regulator [Deinococcus yavapaiensis]|uniref:DNA-binding SARP family transcriptional activator n=1 Tax=Deinococcus yavapaiensis KR-236 TaxID=694435 RepID=A0A318SMJ1_9DEIO|nr:DNA-binding SARP family transcriptional activator [Deinococcus yavapaiensis KR-236]